MALGTRRNRERQQDFWIAMSDVVETPANAFHHRLNQILDAHKFDVKVERIRQLDTALRLKSRRSRCDVLERPSA